VHPAYGSPPPDKPPFDAVAFLREREENEHRRDCPMMAAAFNVAAAALESAMKEEEGRG
jgi:hypothetical protein